MHENGAAPARNGRIVIISKLDDQVVDMVVTPELFVARRIRPFDRPVIVRVTRCVAPAIVRLKRNDLGITPPDGLPVRLAGDCNLCLGADAAAIDGRNAALDILSRIDGADRSLDRLSVDAERRAQARLARIFAHESDAAADLSPDTVLCRCEGMTVADLDALRSASADAAETVREIRLSGRFGMGPCQGRFCLDAVSEMLGGDPPAEALRGNRWPARPIPVSAFIDAIDATDDQSKQEPERQP